jgi:ABC-type multidrug transport system ATPase subunit
MKLYLNIFIEVLYTFKICKLSTINIIYLLMFISSYRYLSNITEKENNSNHIPRRQFNKILKYSLWQTIIYKRKTLIALVSMMYILFITRSIKIIQCSDGRLLSHVGSKIPDTCSFEEDFIYKRYHLKDFLEKNPMKKDQNLNNIQKLKDATKDLMERILIRISHKTTIGNIVMELINFKKNLNAALDQERAEPIGSFVNLYEIFFNPNSKIKEPKAFNIILLILSFLLPDLSYPIKEISLLMNKRCLTELEKKNTASNQYTNQKLQRLYNSISFNTIQILNYSFQKMIPCFVCCVITIMIFISLKYWIGFLYLGFFLTCELIEIALKELLTNTKNKVQIDKNKFLVHQEKVIITNNLLRLFNKIDRDNLLSYDSDSKSNWISSYKDYISYIIGSPHSLSEKKIGKIFSFLHLFFTILIIVKFFTEITFANLLGTILIIAIRPSVREIIRTDNTIENLLIGIYESEKVIESIPHIDLNLFGVQIIDIEAVELRDLKKSYSDKKEGIFQPVNIRIKKGEPLILKGPSGIGKTTLISMLKGLISPTDGEIILHVTDIQGQKRSLDIRNINIASLWNILVDFSPPIEDFSLTLESFVKLANPEISLIDFKMLLHTSSLSEIAFLKSHRVSQYSLGQKARAKLCLMLNKESALNSLKNIRNDNSFTHNFIAELSANNFHVNNRLMKKYPKLITKLKKIKSFYGKEYIEYLFLLFDVNTSVMCLDNLFSYMDRETASQVLKNLNGLIDHSICIIIDSSNICDSLENKADYYLEPEDQLGNDSE